MSEWVQLQLLAIAVLGLGLYTWLYTYGGRQGTSKAWRRVVGAAVLLGACHWLAWRSGMWTPWLLLPSGAFLAAITMGYGGTTLGTKLRRRLLYGAAVSGSLSLLLVFTGRWGEALIQTGLGMAASAYYGIRNPMSAVGEEGLIAALGVITVPFVLIR